MHAIETTPSRTAICKIPQIENTNAKIFFRKSRHVHTQKGVDRQHLYRGKKEKTSPVWTRVVPQAKKEGDVQEKNLESGRRPNNQRQAGARVAFFAGASKSKKRDGGEGGCTKNGHPKGSPKPWRTFEK